MEEDLSPRQRRSQILLSSIFTVAASGFFLFMIGVAFIAWLDGQLKAIEALGIIALNAVLGFFLGLRPLWNQFTPPRR